MEQVREQAARFVEQGYLGPIPLLTEESCRRFLHQVAREPEVSPPDWDKSRATISRAYYEIAAHPAILDIVASLLDDDVMLWGASMIHRAPGAIHPWHTDAESASPIGRTVSVWIGLENTSRDSSLVIIPYSHQFGISVQEARKIMGKPRELILDDDIVAWARQREIRSTALMPEMTDGDALFFDGRLWHGSHNRSQQPRRALLLQFATAATPIRIPNYNSFDWPLQFHDNPKPACLMLRGPSQSTTNRVVAPPPEPAGRLNSQINRLQIPLPPDHATGWKPHHLFCGTTPNLRGISSHASVLVPNHCPHPPHRHPEEELLLLLDGHVELTLPDLPNENGNHPRRLQPGQFVYYPAHFAHTLTAIGDKPASYLMFQWQNDPRPTSSALSFGQFDWPIAPAAPLEPGFVARGLFEGPTTSLEKLHCHFSTLSAGVGYEPHVDDHDVALIILEGEVETLGQRARPYDVVFYPAGQPHGILNPGDHPARYGVFEFHGPSTNPAAPAAAAPWGAQAARRQDRKKLVAISMVKNEDDIIEAFVRHHLAIADHLIIVDHGSDDATSEILDQLRREGLPLDVIHDQSLGKRQGPCMTRLMHEHATRRLHADWIIPLDADEFLIAEPSELAAELSDDRHTVNLPSRVYAPSPVDDPSELNPVLRIRYRRINEAWDLPKVLIPSALAAMPDSRISEGNHDLLHSDAPCTARPARGPWLAHFPVRSPGQFVAKIAIGYLNRLLVPDRQSDWGRQYHRQFEQLKLDPVALLDSFYDAARRFAVPPDGECDGRTLFDPIQYLGGPLKYTRPVDAPWRAARALTQFADQLARESSGLAAGLSDGDKTSISRYAEILASLYKQLTDKDTTLQTKRAEADRMQRDQNALQQQIQESLDREQRLSAGADDLQRQLQSCTDEIRSLRQSWAWWTGDAIIGKIRWIKRCYVRATDG